MPIAAITYDIKPGFQAEITEIFANFRRVGGAGVPSSSGSESSTRILGTSLFIRDDVMVRFIEYEGDLDAVARHMAHQPGVQEIERKLAPYLRKPRDTSTVEGFLKTFNSALLTPISQLSVRDAPARS
ncbi:MAG TPA: SchA/CurD-like domain-containing protein [Pseudonocardiaceae bacterium]|jgi:hypothetical protein|nr:SchA/CurD-like domain-containing protein [Pseudonocardiaceae bacterium]